MEKEKLINIANDCFNCKHKPCMNGCPLNNNIPEFIDEFKKDNFAKAYEILNQTSYLGALCGKICPHYSQCVGKCTRNAINTPVSIGSLESAIAEWGLNNIKNNCTNETATKHIAIVGSGPSALNAAAFLAKYNFKVTIYERKDYLGGLLVYGIPEFRLNSKLVEKVCNNILDLGVDVKYNMILGEDFTLDELKSNYDAVILALGANQSNFPNTEGINLTNVYGANNLLDNQEQPSYVGKNTVIVGGGNVAMDIARIVQSLGAEKTTIVYRKTEADMKAEKHEIISAKEEGIDFVFNTVITKLNGDTNNLLTSIDCINTAQNMNYTKDVDIVIYAIGSSLSKSFTHNLEMTENGYIKVDDTFLTSDNKIYAIGDLVGTKGTVAWAAKNGFDVAQSINKKFN